MSTVKTFFVLPLFCWGAVLSDGPNAEAPTLAYPLPIQERVFEGRVVNPDGTPAAGATVAIRTSPFVDQASTTTGEDGQFSLRFQVVGKLWDRPPGSEAANLWHNFGSIQSADGRYELVPRQKGDDAVRKESEVFRLAERSKTRRPIRVRVVDEVGQAIVVSKVVLENGSSRSAEVVDVDKDGFATVEVIRSSPHWTIHAIAPGRATECVSFFGRLSGHGHGRFGGDRDAQLIESQCNAWLEKNPEPISLCLKPTRKVNVRVIDQNDRPLVGLHVAPRSLRGRSWGPPACPEFSRVTDAKGWVSFDYLPLDYNEPLGFAPDSFGFASLGSEGWGPKANVDEVTLRLARLVPIEGRTTVEGKPYPAFVDAHPTDRSMSGFVTAHAPSYVSHGRFSGPDGSFMLYLAPSRTYTLSAKGKGHVSKDFKGLRVDCDSPVSGIEIELHPFAEITVDLPDAIEIPEARNKNVGRSECSLYRCQGLPNRSFDVPPGKDDDAWLLKWMQLHGCGSLDSPIRKSIPLWEGLGTYVAFGEAWHEPVIFRSDGTEAKSFALKKLPDAPEQAVLTVTVENADANDLHCYPLDQVSSVPVWRQREGDKPGHFTLVRPKVRCLVTCGRAAAIVEPDAESIEIKQRERIRVCGSLIGLPPLLNDIHWTVRLRAVGSGDTTMWGIFGGADFVAPRNDRFHDNRFQLGPIPPRIPVEIQVSDGGQIWHTVAKLDGTETAVTRHTERVVDLGDLQVDTHAIEEARKDLLEAALHTKANGQEAASRIETACWETRDSNKRLLIVIGDPRGALWRDLRESIKKDASLVEPFNMVALSAAPPFHVNTHGFVPWLDVGFAEARTLVVAVADPKDRRLLARFTADAFTVGGALDLEKLAGLLRQFR